MKHVFYFLALVAIVWEMMNISETQKIIDYKKTIKDKNGKNYTSTEYAYAFLTLGYLFWALIGLFSFQWYSFILLLMLSLIPGKMNKYIRKIDAIISIIILVFMVLNAYHFKLSLSELINILP